MKAHTEKARLLRQLISQVLMEMERVCGGVELRSSTDLNNLSETDKSDLTLEKNSDNFNAKMVVDCTFSPSSHSLNASSIADEFSMSDGRWLYEILEDSCLVPVIEHYIKNSSFVEMELYSDLYYSVLRILHLICDCTFLQPLLLQHETQSNSLADIIGKIMRSTITLNFFLFFLLLFKLFRFVASNGLRSPSRYLLAPNYKSS